MASSYDILPDLNGLRASYRAQRDTFFFGGEAVKAHRTQNMIYQIDKMIATTAASRHRVVGAR